MIYHDRPCAYCTSEFTPISSRMKFCSWECRFKSLVPQDADPAKCWEWPMSRNKATGYGQFMVSTKPMQLETAHRLSYSLYKGPLLDGEVVRHSCDNRGCFNPAHLEQGSQEENHQDMCTKKRHCYGESRKNAKLDEEKVGLIRRSSKSSQALAKDFGVSSWTIQAVRSGKTWKLAAGAPTK